MDETSIIFDCQQGNLYCFELLIKNYHIPFHQFCYFLCKNSHDANDLYQQTWLKVYQKIGSFKLEYSFKNWLYTIANNTFKDGQKAPRHERLNEEFLTKPIDRDIKMDLENCILTLTDDFRIPLVLYYYEGFKIEEISEILKLNDGQVKYRLKLAKEKLAKQLEGDYNG